MRKKILIVEDEKHLLRQYSSFLKGVGEIQKATNSKEALSKINKHNFNLLVVDNKLIGEKIFSQDIAGLNILRNVRKVLKLDTPAIFITGQDTTIGDIDIKAEVSHLGSFFMEKPINMEEFLQIVKELMSGTPPNKDKKEKEEMKQSIRSEIEIKLSEDMPPIMMQEVLNELNSKYGTDLLIEVIKDIENISPPVKINTDEIFPYLNFIAYQNQKDDLGKKYPGGFVAFLDGREVGHNPNREDLIGEIYKKYKRTDVFITEIKKRLRTIKIRHPRRVLR
ncbi:MAG: response regulator [Candidatus Aminicenantes bacterium]|jgi:CheY-like chemotaxis protein